MNERFLLSLLVPFLSLSCTDSSEERKLRNSESYQQEKTEKKSETFIKTNSFDNTILYVTANYDGRTALALGETYELQTDKKMNDLVGKTFKFLMEDDSIKEAKISSIQKECRNYLGMGDEFEHVCFHYAVQDTLKGDAIIAFTTVLKEIDFKWTYQPKWHKVDSIDLSKVKENVKRNGGEGYTAVIGRSVGDIKKLHDRYYVLGDTPDERGIDDLLYDFSLFNQESFCLATQDRRWEYYETAYASVLLFKGKIFHVGIKKISNFPGMIVDGEGILNSEKLFFTRKGEFQPSEFDLEANIRLAEVEHEVFYFDKGGRKQELKFEFQPCVSAQWPCSDLHKKEVFD